MYEGACGLYKMKNAASKSTSRNDIKPMVVDRQETDDDDDAVADNACVGAGGSVRSLALRPRQPPTAFATKTHISKPSQHITPTRNSDLELEDDEAWRVVDGCSSAHAAD